MLGDTKHGPWDFCRSPFQNQCLLHTRTTSTSPRIIILLKNLQAPFRHNFLYSILSLLPLRWHSAGNDGVLIIMTHFISATAFSSQVVVPLWRLPAFHMLLFFGISLGPCIQSSCSSCLSSIFDQVLFCCIAYMLFSCGHTLLMILRSVDFHDFFHHIKIIHNLTLGACENNEFYFTCLWLILSMVFLNTSV